MGYIIAYANENTKYEFLMIGKVDTLDGARKTAADYAHTDHQNSGIAVFSDKNDWREHKPMYLYNLHVLYERAKIGGALSGIINARESDWF